MRSRNIATIPPYLQDAHYSGHAALGKGVGYKYAHDFPNHYVDQQYLPDEVEGTVFYEPTEMGHEKEVGEWLTKLKNSGNN